jgi:hypothetical protein
MRSSFAGDQMKERTGAHAFVTIRDYRDLSALPF